MASAAGVRMGRAFVEVGANDASLKKVLANSQKALDAFAASATAVGSKLAGMGAAIAAPLTLGLHAFSAFEDSMANLRAAANPTAEELGKINAAVTAISKQTGQGPAKVAATMTELLKAGMSVESVLGGAAQATIQFARVAEMEAAEAAVTLADAMNVFGQSATDTANALTKAADASSISVRDVAQSFAMAGAVAKQAGLGIDETANAIAVLGQNGVKGSDAGTALKTMLLRLQTGAEKAGDTMASLGINVRTSDGRMKDMRGIVQSLEEKLKGLSGQAKDKAMLDLFGTDAIRAGAILITQGTKGWDAFTEKMAQGLPVAEKFEILMNTLSGFTQRAAASLERIGVAVGAALAPAFAAVAGPVTGFLDVIEALVAANPGLVATVAKVAVAIGAVGAAFLAAAGAASVISTVIAALLPVVGAIGGAIGLVGTVLTAVLSPVGLVVAAVAGLGVYLARTTTLFQEIAKAASGIFGPIADEVSSAFASVMGLFGELKGTAVATFHGIADALKAGNIQQAAGILWAGLEVAWLQGTIYLQQVWNDWGLALVDGFRHVSYQLAGVMTDVWAGIQSGFVSGLSAMQDGFTVFVGFIMKSWTKFSGFFREVWERIKAAFTGEDPTKAIAKIQADVQGKNAATDAKTQGFLDQRKEQRDKSLQGIEANRQDAQGSLATQEQTEVAARRQRADEGLAADRQALADAQSNLTMLTGVAATDAEGAKKDTSTADKKPIVTPEAAADVERGLSGAAKKVEVRGSFSAAAAQGMGAGDSVNSLLEKQNKEAEKQTKQLEKVNDKLRGGLAPKAT